MQFKCIRLYMNDANNYVTVPKKYLLEDAIPKKKKLVHSKCCDILKRSSNLS